MNEVAFLAAGPGGLELPSGRPFWTTPEMAPPYFYRNVVAQVFFGRTTWWINKLFRDHPEFFTEEQLGPISYSTQGGLNPWRQYSLYNIERLIMNVVNDGHFDPAQAARALSIVLLVARQYGHGRELDAVARRAIREREA